MTRTNNLIKKVIFILIITLFLMIIMPLPIVKANNQSSWYNSGEFRDTTYYRTYEKWISKYKVIDGITYTTNMNEMIVTNPSISNYFNTTYQDILFTPNKQEKINYVINVVEEGLYVLYIDYLYNTEFSSNPTIDVEINQNIQYNELTELALEVNWEIVARDDKDRYNRYGDELLPYSVADKSLMHTQLSNCFSELTLPYYVLLKQGKNIVSVTSNQDNLQLGRLSIENDVNLISYEEYQQKYQNYQIASSKRIIEAENITSKNEIEIKAGYYKSYKMTPASYKNSILNMLDGNSQSRSGTTVTYQFNIEENAVYQLSIKYKQNTLAGLAVGKNIYIDGVIPFKELRNYLFPYTSSWENYTLGNDKPFLIYLDKGLHTLTIESSSDHIVNAIDDLYKVMDEINSLGITINTITGSSSNNQITWKITDYLPTLSDDLNNYADKLDEIYTYLDSLDPDSKANEVSSLKVASKQLKRLAKSPNKIQNRLGELSEGSGSAYQLIGNAIGYLINQRLDIDYFAFHGTDYKMARPNGNIFGRIWFSVKSFFYSFFDQRYNIKLSEDNQTIDVWVASSSLYMNIIQEMADDEFTKLENIKVNLNILSNTQAIVLNNATDTNPDIVLDVDSWLPYTYALRGMLEDLKPYPGFDEITEEIYAPNFIPLIYEDGIYGIPQTQGMQLLFYRTDILTALGLTAPNTWDDVIKILPTLQSYQMNFYHPLGNDSAYKGFGLTAPFFNLYDAEVYTNNGFTSSLVDGNAVEALRFMTDLFNVYNLPQQVSSFFEHFRSGTLPIGIGSIDLYLQLKYACPELAGQWAVIPIPGIENDETDVVERYTTTYGKCSIMFAKSDNKENAWKFLRWWHNTTTQAKYVQNIKMNLGEKYLIVPANMKSLENSPWDSEIKTQVIEQAKWSRIPAITPGSYIVEREISNIWNKVVIDKVNVRVAVNQSIPKINRELRRKFEEFKYLKNGEIVKEYRVPNYSNINEWVKGKNYDE